MSIPQLQTLSSYSLLKSTVRLEAYFERAKNDGYTSVALTDENVLYGVLEFCRLAQKYDLTPIIGLTLDYVAEDVRGQILVYAPNLSAYKSLMELSTLTMMKGPQPLTDIIQNGADLLFILPENNPIQQLVNVNQKEQATTLLALFQPLIEAGRFFIGIDPLTITTEIDQMRLNNWLRFLKPFSAKCVATHLVNYLETTDFFSYAILQAISTGAVIDPANIPKSGPNFFVSPFILEQRLHDLNLDDVTANTNAFAQQFGFTPPLKQKLLPHFPLEKGVDAKTYLRQLAEAKLVLRIDQPTQVYRDRLNYELSVIESMGFADYFLIVWDVINYCHTHNITTGVGRGSSASSLVAYVLEITDVDPIKYDLLFERFLNPERVSMPDIDLDFPDNKRDLAINYVAAKYGAAQVSQIATFGTLAAKQVLRDVARVFGLSKNESDQWSNAIPMPRNGEKINLAGNLEKSPSLQKLVNESERNALLFKTATQLEGLPRNLSTHAAGMVIGDGPLVQWMPLQNGTGGIALSQFTKDDVEALGLLKMDFLGLRNLTFLGEAVELTSQLLQRPFSVAEISYDDKKTLQLFAKAEMVGIFQFESDSARAVMKKIKPTNFEDIIAINALNRPGPRSIVDSFARRKNGQEKISYPDPSLEGILGITYGYMVYQEQIMQVANRLAGFTMGQADILRRAMSKKKKALLDEQRQKFITGVVNNHHSKEVGERVYSYIEEFAGYGFARSHAVAYSVLAFELAYIKAHFPKAFYTAILNAGSNQDDKLKKYLGAAKKAQLAILGPDINASGRNFTMTNEGIRFGLGKIKGLRSDFLRAIITERKNGPYRSLDDFIFRIDVVWRKKDLLVPLILAGAFDKIDANRRQLMTEVDSKIKSISYSGGSDNLLAALELKEDDVSEYPLPELLDYEENYLGTFISGHPLEITQAYESQYATTSIDDYEEGQVVQTFIYLKEIRKMRTKKGEQMAFLTAQDFTGEMSYTIFPQLFRQVFLELKNQELYLVKGKVQRSRFKDSLEVLVDTIYPFNQIKDAPVLFLRVNTTGADDKLLYRIATILKKNPGISPVNLFYADQNKVVRLDAEFNVNAEEKVLESLIRLVQKENVVLQIP